MNRLSRAIALVLGLVGSSVAGGQEGEPLPFPAGIKAVLVWQTGAGASVVYDKWPEEKKRRLLELYQKLKRGEKDLGLARPSPENIRSSRAYFTEEQAFDVYAAHVAHCLHVEAAKLVPWTLRTFPHGELEVLFHSSRYHAPILRSKTVDYPPGIQPGRDFQEAPEYTAQGELNADPRIAFDFVTGKTSTSGTSLVGKTPLETMVNLTIWMRDNLQHGAIPVSKNPDQPWLEDRLRIPSGKKTAVANTGCHSAAKLFVDLARSINLPVLSVRTLESTEDTSSYFIYRTHAGLLFGWGRPHPRLLWHVDEIYADTGEPSYPIDKEGKLLTPEAAGRAYFEQRWEEPEELAKFGFAYALEKIVPGKGLAGTKVSEYESRADFGMAAGAWRNKGKSKLQNIWRQEGHYTLGGDNLPALLLKRIIVPQLTNNFKAWRAELEDADMPPLHTPQEYSDRAKAVLQALGGEEGYRKAKDEWTARRGSTLLKN